MSWFQALYETFERCVDTEQATQGEVELVPVGHTIQQAHIEIAIDSKGNFLRARVLDREKTVIPASEDSASRSGKKPAPHPLADRVRFCAGDYLARGGQKAHFFEDYLKQLSGWCSVSYAHPKAVAVLAYVSKQTLVADLGAEQVLFLDKDRRLLTSWEGDQVPLLFQMLTKEKVEGRTVQDQGDAFVRWVVEVPGTADSATWGDRGLIESWQRYVASADDRTDVCTVSGRRQALATKHPRGLRHSADNARLVSSNDATGFTFRGRFLEAEEACVVGFEVTQKAHSALRWLIARQGYKNDSQVVVTWAVSGAEVPNPLQSTLELWGLQKDGEQVPSAGETEPGAGDFGQLFAGRLRRRLAGYAAKLPAADNIVILGLDSATPGRMAVIYFRELTASEFLARIEEWHTAFAWPQRVVAEDSRDGKTERRVGWQPSAPSPKQIASAAYGRRLDEKLSKATVERILPCIVDGRELPRDLVERVVARASARVSFDEYWEWEQALGVACAVFKGAWTGRLILKERRHYTMTLESTRVTRDYLYGRLLAYAEHIEERALLLAGERRDTMAARLMQRFADRPFSTWRTIEASLVPYQARLRARWPGYLVKLSEQMDSIFASFVVEDFTDESRLSGEYLLGYHCQRMALRAPRDGATDEPASDGKNN